MLRLQRDHYRLKLGRAGLDQLELWLSDARKPPPPCTGAKCKLRDLSSGGVGFVMDASQPELAPKTGRLPVDAGRRLSSGGSAGVQSCPPAAAARPAWHYGCEFLNHAAAAGGLNWITIITPDRLAALIRPERCTLRGFAFCALPDAFDITSPTRPAPAER